MGRERPMYLQCMAEKVLNKGEWTLVALKLIDQSVGKGEKEKMYRVKESHWNKYRIIC